MITTISEITTQSSETEAFGRRVAQSVSEGTIFAFFGSLGAGKTTFIRGFVEACVGGSSHVSSPTFTYLHIYSGAKKVHHFDLYRLKNAQDFIDRGFEEFLFAPDAIVCVEWSEKIETLLPVDAIKIELSLLENGKRRIEMKR